MAAVTRRQVLRELTAGAVALGTCLAQTRRPNIVVILADDLGWGDVGFNGRQTWSTPNLDRLSSQGTRFTRFYSGAVVCNPARACLLTGKYSIHNGVKGYNDDLPASETTLAEALKPLGYETALFGKWHAGRLPDGSHAHPLDQGFDEFLGFTSAVEAWQHFPKDLYRNRDRVDAEGYTADIFSDEAIKFIERERTTPFFLYLAYTETHSLIEAPAYDVARFRGRFEEESSSVAWNATYAAMVERLDWGIGRVLDALERTGQADNTIVVFSSDQGATFEPLNRGASYYHDSNFPLRGQKRSVEEGGIRVPGIVRWPGRIPAGQTSNLVVHFIDLFPTLLAGARGQPDPSWKVDGLNLLDVWQGKASPPERTVFWEWEADAGDLSRPNFEGVRMSKHAVIGIRMYAAMRGHFKLLEINGARFLFNVEEDPGERRTLATEYPDLFRSLQTELERWKATDVTK